MKSTAVCLICATEKFKNGPVENLKHVARRTRFSPQRYPIILSMASTIPCSATINPERGANLHHLPVPRRRAGRRSVVCTREQLLPQHARAAHRPLWQIALGFRHATTVAVREKVSLHQVSSEAPLRCFIHWRSVEQQGLLDSAHSGSRVEFQLCHLTTSPKRSTTSPWRTF